MPRRGTGCDPTGTVPCDLRPEQYAAAFCAGRRDTLPRVDKESPEETVPTTYVGLFAAALVLLAAAVTTPTATRAQDDLREKGKRFCSSDARRLCKDVLGQGDGFVLSCFQEQRKRLSTDCRKFLTDIGQLN
jgi:hypothetical protein